MRIAVLSVLCAVCSVLILVMVKRQDTAAPEIVFERTPLYYDGRDRSSLLEGVTALDGRDGDVTDTLMVSCIYPLTGETGIVVYAAKDSSNNVATAGRGFFYEGTDAGTVTGISGWQTGDGVSPGAFGDGTAAGTDGGAAGGTAGEAGNGAAGGNGDAGTDGGVAGNGTDGGAAGADGGTAGAAGGNGDAGAAGADGNGDAGTAGAAGGNGDAGAGLPGEGQLSGEQYDRLREENLAQGIPFVRLVQHEAVLARGSAFNIYRYIDEAVDDADSIRTMLRVEGTVDTDTPGEYELRVFARDSDGNQSNVELLKVTVE